MNYIKLKSKGNCRKGQGKQQVNLFFYFIFMRYKYLSKWKNTACQCQTERLKTYSWRRNINYVMSFIRNPFLICRCQKLVSLWKRACKMLRAVQHTWTSLFNRVYNMNDLLWIVGLINAWSLLQIWELKVTNNCCTFVSNWLKNRLHCSCYGGEAVCWCCLHVHTWRHAQPKEKWLVVLNLFQIQSIPRWDCCVNLGKAISLF